ncbi:MAG: citrate synthase [Deltaproteobacteria bacterium]|nr:citrate synthase [Deltaproteobacteria bacterium]MBI2500120.1 citrate synthase [Deltaproteobacteria bacterium]MBI4196208.1 citrate synthase [Deltaproteobacteria bacterium]
MTGTKAGLEGIIAGESQICWIDGQKGELVYSGYTIHDLALHSTFEEVAFLLWNHRLPNKRELQYLISELEENSDIPDEIMDFLQRVAPRLSAMGMLRTFVSMLAHFDPEAGDRSRSANENKALRIVAKIPTLIAAFDRLRKGNRIVPLKKGQNLATRFLHQLKGKEPVPEASKAMDVALVLHAEHSFNASTFAARVCASTLSDIYSSVTAAIATLKGPLHGGANEEVIKMLRQIGHVSRVKPYIESELADRKKIFGFGHRVYKTMDPRATHLMKMSENLGRATNNLKWFELSLEIQRVMKELKGLDPNVDFYSASLYETLGIPSDLFTGIFAMSRSTGWTAHILEQYNNNRLIRPECEYTGQRGLPYVPIDQRQ